MKVGCPRFKSRLRHAIFFCMWHMFTWPCRWWLGLKKIIKKSLIMVAAFGKVCWCEQSHLLNSQARVQAFSAGWFEWLIALHKLTVTDIASAHLMFFYTIEKKDLKEALERKGDRGIGTQHIEPLLSVADRGLKGTPTKGCRRTLLCFKWWRRSFAHADPPTTVTTLSRSSSATCTPSAGRRPQRTDPLPKTFYTWWGCGWTRCRPEVEMWIIFPFG